MAEQHPRTLYTKELIHKGRGYPFWYPEPDSSASAEFKERGIYPGDVGILNNDGGFNFLFNIFGDANGRIDERRVPPGFQPLPEPTSRDVQISPAHGDVLKSQHVSCREVSAGASAQGLQSIQVDAGVSFDVSIMEASAAILFLPNCSTKYEALNKAPIKDYAQ
ncbi:uncharacterized protein EV420DRAFT_1643085 [Desarmillaria tabescens]|uniref:Uncharacterized protein n=1 Tax=Armillaria tabescens TaxID=1929756 RepID=A0AA39N5P1_ARMTA|nr:uncharacterized protein EV420DRAFT_1643085 [Desarmillaria tabescens]KAK0458210.1 hypothetical protein EV420DRAFT_1643085 [Desarmillaria tabescens]